MLHQELNPGSGTLTEATACQQAKREGRDGRRWGHSAAGKWPKRSMRMGDIDCGGLSDDREITWLGFSLAWVRLVKGGVAVERSPDVTSSSIVLCPFRRSAKVHLAPTNKPAGSAKEWQNLVVREGGDGVVLLWLSHTFSRNLQ